MKSVYIEGPISKKNLSIVESIIKKYNASIVDNENQVDLIIVEKNQIYALDKPFTKCITVTCLILMDKELIDPFSYKGQSNFLYNIFLRKKTFDIINCSEKLKKQCTDLIKSMDGEIKKDNPDYYLTEKYTGEETPNCVHINWLFALQFSKKYIFPQQHLIINYKNDVNKEKVKIQNSAKLIEKSNFNYTPNFIQTAYDIRKKSKYSFPRLRKELRWLSPIGEALKDEPNDIFKDACQIGFSQIKSGTGQFNDVFFEYNKAGPLTLNEKKCHSQILRSAVLCGSVKHSGRWAESETRRLIYFLNESFYANLLFTDKNKIDWVYIATHIPGRTPKCCSDKYRQLISDGVIEDFSNQRKDKVIDKISFNKYLKKSFTPGQEKEILLEIYKRIDEGQLVTSKDIADIALRFFYSPLFLSIKAIVSSSLEKKEWPFDKDGNLEIANINEEINKLLPRAEEKAEDLMAEYNIKKFKASPSWVSKFMKRNNLVYRSCHFERRGAIRFEDVDEFLSQFADALTKYKKSHILNLDETYIKTFNHGLKQIARKGQTEVKVFGDKYNEKEGTTYLATLSMDSDFKIPLYLIAHGSSEACEAKHQIDNGEDIIGHSKSGWTTADIMIDYLRWLSHLMNNEPFALLIDRYRAHLQKRVTDEAEKLKIELILIPRCGTGLFQPLDRYIFGVLKRKLRTRNIEINDSNNQERYRIVHQEVSDIWKNLDSSLIKKAWDIPGLDKYVYPDVDDKKDPDYLPSD